MTRLLQDILREPEDLAGSLAYSLGEGRPALERAAQIVNEGSHVYITGIGSSWHAGMAVLVIQRLRASGEFAGCIGNASFHRSGLEFGGDCPVEKRKECGDCRVAGKLPSRDVKIIAVTNTLDSPLAQQADACLPLHVKLNHLVLITMYSGLTLVGSLAASMALGALPGRRLGELTASLEAARTALAGWQEETKRVTGSTPKRLHIFWLAEGVSRAR